MNGFEKKVSWSKYYGWKKRATKPKGKDDTEFSKMLC